MPIRAGDGLPVCAWPVIGRDRELAQLRHDSTVLAGPAGIGKTVLVRQACRRLAEEGHRIEWIAGTRTSAAMPYAAIAHLLPPGWRWTGEPFDLFRAVRDHAAALDGREALAGGQPGLVLAVDDAHLIDDGSAAVVAELVRRELATVVATTRTAVVVPDAIGSLWKDGVAARMDLGPLSCETIDQLIQLALVDPMDGLSRRRLREAVSGNPMMLRELLHSGLTEGGLEHRHGLWWWTDPVRPSARTADLVADRLRHIDDPTRRVLDLVAYAGVVPVEVVLRWESPDAVAAAEKHGLLVCDAGEARIGDPLVAAVIRAALPRSTAQSSWQRLARTALADPLLRKDGRAALWQVEGGDITEPDVVAAGARAAFRRTDLVAAERLARAVHTPDLARILEHRGGYAEAAALPAPDVQTRAEIAYWGTGEVTDAHGTAAHSWILLFDGRCAEALTSAGALIDSPDEEAALTAAASATAAAGFLGRHRVAEAFYERGIALVRRRPDLVWGALQLGYGNTLAQLAGGDLIRGRRRTDCGYAAAIEAHAPVATGIWSALRGLIAVAQGRPSTARLGLLEAVGALDGNEPWRMLQPTSGGLVVASALSGFVDAAQQWQDRAEAAAGPWNRVLGPWMELARGWRSAACGAMSEAVESVRRAAALAGSLGLPTVEAMAAYDIVRLGGRADLHRLRQLASECAATEGEPDGPAGGVVAVLAQAAIAFSRDDGEALAAAAHRFEDLGYTLHAAEAMVGAAHACRTTGRRASARVYAERAIELRARCEGAVTVLSGNGQLIEALTPREREVVLLAVGHSTAQIADTLGLSANTVSNNLARAYAKLGVSGRVELRTLLG